MLMLLSILLGFNYLRYWKFHLLTNLLYFPQSRGPFLPTILLRALKVGLVVFARFAVFVILALFRSWKRRGSISWIPSSWSLREIECLQLGYLCFRGKKLKFPIILRFDIQNSCEWWKGVWYWCIPQVFVIFIKWTYYIWTVTHKLSSGIRTYSVQMQMRLFFLKRTNSTHRLKSGTQKVSASS